MDTVWSLVVTLVAVGVVLVWWARAVARSAPAPPPRPRGPGRSRVEASAADRTAPPRPLPPPMSEIPRPAPRRRSHVPSPVAHRVSVHPPVGEPPAQPVRTWAERFILPPSVSDAIRHPDDPVDVVRAILEAGGVPVEVDREVLRTGGHFIAVVTAPGGRPVVPNVLSRLYLRFLESGATDGVALCLCHLDPVDIGRRELLAPELRHEGSDAVQRMADAVAAGEDPLAALAPTPLVL